MQLVVNGWSIPIAQMRPDYLLLNAPVDHPPTDANVIVQIDETESRWNIHLPNGISAASKRVAIERPR